MGSANLSLRVLIIGAGSAGLLTAQVFKKVGIDVTVFEQDASPTTRLRDWNFGIYWAQSRLTECLPDELNALVETTQTDPTYKPTESSVMPVYNGTTGELLKNLPAPYSIRLRRRPWLKLIGTGIDVRYRKKLISISAADSLVTATFSDGTQETGNLLVGAEGAHSITRKWLLGPDEGALLRSPVVASVTITKIDRDIAVALRRLHPRYLITFNPNGLFTWMSIHECLAQDPADWTWMLMQTWRSDQETGLNDGNILDDVYARAQNLAYPFKEVYTTIPKGTKVWHNRLGYWPTKPWDSRAGLVTLAGDSAHPMTFHRGQGLNNAISDAADLQTRLRTMSAHTPAELAKAVHAYEKELWVRGHEAVMASHENTNAVHDWTTMLQSPLFVGGLAKAGDQVQVSEKVDK